ncbi:leucyl/phenylalanyl-tRNA--protein transferase [Motilimonas cestriensis]|uniref:Leucyl/phenylalanyl-tRNA--protein transferase n=1 Tax=Motilimonas cestriensis TaxID=2742685 RepID=A0ABS8WB20_9GAMM|nr:leucyl/phenylalanyl-tRNA--protein transferase [Motilimonas cestriensis]MCE2595675.1 leucyl/phenylalanyl-tRNA--protein transferase [Motilimonas cestriensis]
MNHFITQLSQQASLFPDPSLALTEPDGLLAVGGDLSPARLLAAYRKGIFPWYSDDQPIMWWSPSERATIKPSQVHISRSMARLIRQDKFEITVNVSFTEVIKACADERKDDGTWITPDMQQAYTQLHQLGHAHSIEVWQQAQLVGGIYGVSIGRLFCGESMFHRATNASKIAFIALCQHFKQHGGNLIDAQIPNPHLTSLGVKSQTRADFLIQAQQLTKEPIGTQCWTKQTIHLKSS